MCFGSTLSTQSAAAEEAASTSEEDSQQEADGYYHRHWNKPPHKLEGEGRRRCRCVNLPILNSTPRCLQNSLEYQVYMLEHLTILMWCPFLVMQHFQVYLWGEMICFGSEPSGLGSLISSTVDYCSYLSHTIPSICTGKQFYCISGCKNKCVHQNSQL